MNDWTMSSEISTKSPAEAGHYAHHDAKSDSSLQPWQFFVLAALGCATAVTFLVRGHGVVPVILLSARIIVGREKPSACESLHVMDLWARVLAFFRMQWRL